MSLPTRLVPSKSKSQWDSNQGVLGAFAGGLAPSTFCIDADVYVDAKSGGAIAQDLTRELLDG